MPATRSLTNPLVAALIIYSERLCLETPPEIQPRRNWFTRLSLNSGYQVMTDRICGVLVVILIPNGRA